MAPPQSSYSSTEIWIELEFVNWKLRDVLASNTRFIYLWGIEFPTAEVISINHGEKPLRTIYSQIQLNRKMRMTKCWKREM